MFRMIMKLIRNRSFTLTTANGKCSRQRRLKNSFPQGYVLAPLLFQHGRKVQELGTVSTKYVQDKYGGSLASRI